MSHRTRLTAAALAAVTLAGVAVAVNPALMPAAEASAQGITPVGQGSRIAYEQNTIDVTNKYGPSVVAIDVKVEGKAVNPLQNLPPQLRQFFKQFGGKNAPQQKSYERAAGSGFVIDDNGEIMTNYHVVAAALKKNSTELKPSATINVHFSDDSKGLAATVVGVDMSYDLALLRLDHPADRPDNAIPIPLADSDSVQVGEKAIAIGNPFALESTVTQGIVSAVNRRQAAEVSGVPINYVQTDAAVNPGSSGGPLLNSRGQAIGVNDEILAPNGTFAGVGFAIPSSLVKQRLSELKSGGLYKKAQIGVAMANLADYPPKVRKVLGVPDYGVMVAAVAKGGPADKAGLQPAQYTVNGAGHRWPAGGDVILKADGKKIKTGEDLQNIVYSLHANDKVHLKVLSDGEKEDVTLKLAILK